MWLNLSWHIQRQWFTNGKIVFMKKMLKTREKPTEAQYEYVCVWRWTIHVRFAVLCGSLIRIAMPFPLARYMRTTQHWMTAMMSQIGYERNENRIVTIPAKNGVNYTIETSPLYGMLLKGAQLKYKKISIAGQLIAMLPLLAIFRSKDSLNTDSDSGHWTVLPEILMP